MRGSSPYDSERQVLGMLLLDWDEAVLCEGVSTLKAALFGDPRHRLIAQAALDLSRAERPVDLLTVSDALRERLRVAGGRVYVTGLVRDVFTTALLSYRLAVLRKLALSRVTRATARLLEDASTLLPVSATVAMLRAIADATEANDPDRALQYLDVLRTQCEGRQ